MKKAPLGGAISPLNGERKQPLSHGKPCQLPLHRGAKKVAERGKKEKTGDRRSPAFFYILSISGKSSPSDVITRSGTIVSDGGLPR